MAGALLHALKGIAICFSAAQWQRLDAEQQDLQREASELLSLRVQIRHFGPSFGP